MDSDDERERKPKKAKKPKVDAASGDEAEPKKKLEDGEAKKKRKGKLKKAGSDQGDEEPAMFSDDEEIERPAKKVSNYPHPVHLDSISCL